MGTDERGTEMLAVMVEFMNERGERGYRYGYGHTTDDAVENALCSLCGPDDPYNERHGWAMLDWQAA
jgi:hypothetical protein